MNTEKIEWRTILVALLALVVTAVPLAIAQSGGIEFSNGQDGVNEAAFQLAHDEGSDEGADPEEWLDVDGASIDLETERAGGHDHQGRDDEPDREGDGANRNHEPEDAEGEAEDAE